MAELKRYQCSSIEDWKKLYEEKTGDKYETDKSFLEMYLPERGLCQMTATEKMVVVGSMSGDGKFWRDVAEILARIMGKKMLGTLCVRQNPEAYMRLFGYKLTKKTRNPDGREKYYGMNQQGQHILISPAYRDGAKEVYYCTWEVSKDVINANANRKNQSENT